MKTETTLGAAMRHAGARPREWYQFLTAAMICLEAGVSAADMIEEIQKLAREDQVSVAPMGLVQDVPARQPNGDVKDRARIVVKDLSDRVPTSPPKANGAGQTLNAVKAGAALPTPVRTSHARIAALKEVAKSAAKTVITVLDTFKIDGRAIGDWTVGEARRVGKDKTYHGAVLLEATRIVANAPGNAKLREVVKPAEMQRIIQRASEVADAA